jgi:hypothetical protein
MDIISGDELAQHIDEYICRAANDERIILNHHGKQAALVSLDDLMLLEGMDHQLDQRDVPVAQQRLADPSQIPMPFVPTIAPHQAAEQA